MFAALHLPSCPPDLTREELLTHLAAVACDMTPRWERLSSRDLVLDVSGLQRILGGPEQIAAAARTLAADRQLDARVAIAPAWTTALTLAASGVQAIVPRGGMAAALAPLPIEALGALPGVDLVLDGDPASLAASIDAEDVQRRGRAERLRARWLSSR